MSTGSSLERKQSKHEIILSKLSDLHGAIDRLEGFLDNLSGAPEPKQVPEAASARSPSLVECLDMAFPQGLESATSRINDVRDRMRSMLL